MKKALIYTLYGNHNYGNKLQNYAVQKILNNNKVEAYTVVLKKINDAILLKNVKKMIKFLIPKYNRQLKNEKERLENFLKFDLNINKVNYDDLNFRLYDYLVVGSDQVWNPYDQLSRQLVKTVNKIDNIKKISFAASISAEDIPNDLLEEYKFQFNSMNYLSVREEKGKKLIERITKRKDIVVLLDPTLLLTADEWKILGTKPKNFNSKKYILNYFLGDISANRKKEIEKVAKVNNCDIINILDKNEYYYTYGPNEFIWLIKNATLICTDSYHSCIFSFLFNRPFIVFDREQEGINNMNSRLDTFLNMFNLENRKFNNSISHDLLRTDYEEAYKILNKEREKSNKFIKKGLEI